MALQDYETTAKLIVVEEKKDRLKLPTYPELDRGAFSVVYKAQNRHSGQLVAIKIIRKHELMTSQIHLHDDIKGKQADGVKHYNIIKEVQIMRNLNHPNVVKMYEFCETDQFYYLVLELLAGGELFHQIVRLTYFSENLSRNIMVQVAQAVRYLHEECGIVHRDIKPENLLFERIPIIPSRFACQLQPGDEDKIDEGEFVPGVGGGGIGVIKLADFGLSKIIWDQDTLTPCGTVGYTAPEIVKDQKYSKSVDMWALGCVLYTLLCGFPPFYDESIHALTEKVALGQYTFLSPWWDNVSKSAKDLISHLLTVDPNKRYTVDDFLSHPWIRQSLNEDTSPAEDAPPTTKTERSSFLTDMPRHSLGLISGPPFHHTCTSDFRSPSEINMKEVFDVSYAVHLLGEGVVQRRRFGNATSTQPFGIFANSVRHEGDCLEDIVDIDESSSLATEFQYKVCLRKDRYKRRKDAMRADMLHENKVTPTTKYIQVLDRQREHDSLNIFKLNLDGATLINRRKVT